MVLAVVEGDDGILENLHRRCPTRGCHCGPEQWLRLDDERWM